jgi:hypothetical protein
MKLAEIAKKLRSQYSEKDIVAMIKNREIDVIEDNFNEQKNYPNGVFVYSHDEDHGILFGEAR